MRRIINVPSRHQLESPWDAITKQLEMTRDGSCIKMNKTTHRAIQSLGRESVQNLGYSPRSLDGSPFIILDLGEGHLLGEDLLFFNAIRFKYRKDTVQKIKPYLVSRNLLTSFQYVQSDYDYNLFGKTQRRSK